ncbi:Hypothetical protein FKW44_019823 [Caligus rogercresseyi]|uniref:Uncharacterized protein n=1 Tax=Caligus rogercresseyi TaxID=217165 RepID=A0A7T8GWY1_CALRO|nr:Hypothetical protein FKW44_019823 [Caligus rogercresseyi]
MIKKKVSRVRPLAGDDEAYVIDTEDGYQQEQNIYDAVVIAAPLTLDMNKTFASPNIQG